jgi:hypothetical protein
MQLYYGHSSYVKPVSSVHSTGLIPHITAHWIL